MADEHAPTQLVYGEWLRPRRRPAEARGLAAAVSAFERLGAQMWTDRASGELAAFGKRAAEPQLSGSLTVLTPQERAGRCSFPSSYQPSGVNCRGDVASAGTTTTPVIASAKVCFLGSRMAHSQPRQNAA